MLLDLIIILIIMFSKLGQLDSFYTTSLKEEPATAVYTEAETAHQFQDLFMYMTGSSCNFTTCSVEQTVCCCDQCSNYHSGVLRSPLPLHMGTAMQQLYTC
jgi:hypothetical protein